MRHLILILLCLSWTRSQEVGDEEKRRLIELYGTPPPGNDSDVDLTPGKSTSGATSKPENRGGEVSQAEKDRLAQVFDGGAECELKDHQPGVCVLHYLCNPDSGTVITDGATILDIRQRECPHYLQVCCREEQTTDQPPPAPATPQAACGWSNPGAQAFRVRNEAGAADFGDFPWMVAILNRKDGSSAWSQEDYLGGGSIIHPSVVLTVAHKIENKEAKQIKCRAGEYDTQTDKEVYPHQERNVKKIVQHPEFYRPSVYNSMAILVLERPFELANAPHMGVGCVAPGAPPAGARCFSMGWGHEFHDKDKYAVVLKKIELPWVPHEKCQKALRKTRLGSHFVLHPSLACAGGEPGIDTCRGDGGSPLVCPIDDTNPETGPARYAIFGMVAWGIGCGDAVPGVYVNVPHLRAWLGDAMRAEGFGADSYTY